MHTFDVPGMRTNNSTKMHTKNAAQIKIRNPFQLLPKSHRSSVLVANRARLSSAKEQHGVPMQQLYRRCLKKDLYKTTVKNNQHTQTKYNEQTPHTTVRLSPITHKQTNTLHSPEPVLMSLRVCRPSHTSKQTNYTLQNQS